MRPIHAPISRISRLYQLDSIQLGPGTDLAATAQLLPELHVQPLVDPVVMLNGEPDTIHRTIEEVAHGTGGHSDCHALRVVIRP